MALRNVSGSPRNPGNRFSGWLALAVVTVWWSVSPMVFATGTVVDVDIDWAVKAGGTSNDEAADVAIAPDGSVVVTGYFQGTATFAANATATSQGGRDIFLAKYNSNGTLAWVKRAGGTGDDWGRGVAVAQDGSIWLTGYFSGTATFGPGEAGQTSRTSAGGLDIFNARLDSNGTLTFVRQSGSATDDVANAISAATDGGAVFTGWYSSSLSVNRDGADSVTIPSAAPNDIVIARFNSVGTVAWVRRIYGSGNDVTNDVSIGPDGSVEVTGTFGSTAYFGVETQFPLALVSVGGIDSFVAKYSSAGTFLWANRMGGSSVDEARGVVVNSYGSVQVGVNMIYDAAIGGEQVTPGGNADAFVVRYTADGALASVDRTSGPSTEAVGGMAAASDFQMAVCGTLAGPSNFGYQNVSPSGGVDAFIAFLIHGQWGPVYPAGGAGTDVYRRTAMSGAAAVAAGYFSQTATVHARASQTAALTSYGGTDIWVVKYLTIIPAFADRLTATITTANPVHDSTLTCSAVVENPSPAIVTEMEYRWYRDGALLDTPLLIDSQLIPVSGPELSHYYVRMGHSYFCRVKLTDGVLALTADTQTVDIPIPTPPAGSVVTQSDLDYEVVMAADQPWEQGAVAHPWILYDSGKYHMWYSTGDGDPGPGTIYTAIGHAESLDGQLWTNKSVVVRATQDGGSSTRISYPTVYKSGSQFTMNAINYSIFYNSANWTYITARASNDGLAWGFPVTIHGPATHKSWEVVNYGIDGAFHDLITEQLRMFYGAAFTTSAVTPKYYFNTMSGADDVTWTSHMQMQGQGAANLYADRNSFAFYQEPDGLYRMLYAGLDGRMHRASSWDGMHWNGIVDGWNDAESLHAVLEHPPVDIHRPQYVKLLDGRQYLYFSLWSPTPGSPVFQIARMRLRPPIDVVATAHVTPDEPSVVVDLTCTVDITVPTQTANLATTYQWVRDGSELTQAVMVGGIPYETTGPVLAHQITKRGESYYCRVKISDGTSYVYVTSNTVEVYNRTPVGQPPAWYLPEVVLLKAGSGAHPNLLDLREYVSDDSTARADLLLRLMSQSNAAIVDVTLAPDGRLSATVQGSSIGVNYVVLEAEDEVGNVSQVTLEFVVGGATAVGAEQWLRLR